MPKIRVNYVIKSSDDFIDRTIMGIKRENNIIFKDDGYNYNFKVFSDKVMMKRENNETLLEIIISDDCNFKYYLKKYNKYLNLDIHLIEFEISDQKINFKYNCADKYISFMLRYEVIK